jgi:hypothetical protein
MGHKFSLVLSRVISEEESAVLAGAGCSCAIFGMDTLPTNADVTVTKMDFDDPESPSIADAIEAALEAVKTVPDLTVPGLMVPAVPKEPEPAPESESAADAQSQQETQTGEETGVLEGVVVESAPKAAARKPRARKATAKAAANGDGQAEVAAKSG